MGIEKVTVHTAQPLYPMFAFVTPQKGKDCGKDKDSCDKKDKPEKDWPDKNTGISNDEDCHWTNHGEIFVCKNPKPQPRDRN
jgi:hypothetical protein